MTQTHVKKVFLSNNAITVASGGTITVAGTLAVTGTLSVSGAYAPASIAATGDVHCATTFEALGISSFGSAAQTTISAAGVYASAAALSCGVATVTSLVIGAGQGTIADPSDVLTLTETAISLVGNSSVTGTFDVSSTFTVATNKLSVAAGTGIMTLENGATIGNHVSGTLALTTTTIAVAGILTVSGASTLTGAVTMSAAASVGTTLTVTGLATLNGGLTLAGSGVITWSTDAANACVIGTFNGNAAKWDAPAGTPAFVAAHPYVKISLGGTTYRIPIFKDA